MTTAFTVYSSLGILQNSGFAVSPTLISKVSEYNAQGITASAQACLSSSSGQKPAIRQALKSVPEFLTGITSDAKISNVPLEIQNSSNLDNLVSEVTSHALTVFGSGTKRMLSILNKVNTFVNTSYNIYSNFDLLSKTKITDYGFTINNYKDILTGGVSNQFSSFGNQNYKDLAEQIGNFGTMFDIIELTRITKPSVLCKNLLNQGFSIIGDTLINSSIDLISLDDIDDSIVLASLSNIKGKDLQNIVNVTNFKSYSSLTSLSDVFNINFLLSPSARVAAGGTLSKLESKFINLDASFDSFASLGEYLLTIDSNVDVQVFDTLTSSQIDSFISTAVTSLGRGRGVFGNPTFFDVLGSLVGYGYISSIQAMIDSQIQILNNELGQNLKLSIDNALSLGNDDPDGIIAANNILLSVANLTNSTSLADIITQANLKFTDIFTQLITEKQNFLLLSLTEDELEFSIEIMQVFVSTLETVHVDTNNLGQSEFLKQLSDNTVFGKAIKASIIEGYNRSLRAEQFTNTLTTL